jgi:hypothetical protein
MRRTPSGAKKGFHMRRVLIGALAATAISVATPALAVVTVNATGTSAATGGTLSATATFDINGSGHLIVTLSNTAGGDINDPADILHALFFNITGNPSLTYTAGNICSGCSFTGSGTIGTDVGNEWGYITNPSGGGLTQMYGLSSAGYGIGSYTFVAGDSIIQPHTATQPDGGDYGLVPTGYVTTGDNGGVTNNQPYINNGVVFDLGAFNGSLSSIGNVRFQYGTDITKGSLVPGVPEPATWAMMLLGFGGIGMSMRRTRKRTSTLMQVA